MSNQSYSVLISQLTNIEPGRYVFELTVTDDQGESDRDTVSVQVKPDPLEMSLMEMTLNTPVSTFTQGQLDTLIQKMTLLLKGGTQVNVTEVRGEIDSGNTQLIFFLSENVSIYFCSVYSSAKRVRKVMVFFLSEGK